MFFHCSSNDLLGGASASRRGADGPPDVGERVVVHEPGHFDLVGLIDAQRADGTYDVVTPHGSLRGVAAARISRVPADLAAAGAARPADGATARPCVLVLPQRRELVHDIVGAADAHIACFAAGLCRKLTPGQAMVWGHT